MVPIKANKPLIIFFVYNKFLGITNHLYNMIISISQENDIVAVYDKILESSDIYLKKICNRNIKLIDILNLESELNTRFKNRPLLFHCHGFTHLAKAAKFKRAKDKILITVHGFKDSIWYGKVFALYIYIRFKKAVDKWHFLSRKSQESFFWFRSIPENSCVFPLGVEELFFKRIAEPCVIKDLDGKTINDLPDRVKIVYIARFEAWKRHTFLLRALRTILTGNTFLILLGEGPTLKKIIDLARKLEIRDNVIFTGRVDRKKVHYILSVANLAVTVSSSETFGWCILEPFCMDIPVVTTNVGVANCIINDFYNGFILNPNCTEEKFLEKIKMALKYLHKVDNSKTKHLYHWETFGNTVFKCYYSIFESSNQNVQL